ncbi:hypothetical protein [Microcoleus vaginatus]|uniref:hypothetical protein n=1 Tax=Microcoleus vaginatus TaxID=119532 RepID=UPI001F6083C1
MFLVFLRVVTPILQYFPEQARCLFHKEFLQYSPEQARCLFYKEFLQAAFF